MRRKVLQRRLLPRKELGFAKRRSRVQCLRGVKANTGCAAPSSRGRWVGARVAPGAEPEGEGAVRREGERGAINPAEVPPRREATQLRAGPAH